MMKTPLSPTVQAVSVWPATSLVISNMIGTGVFMSLGFQIWGFGLDQLQGGVFSLIMLWIIGGIVAMCGALCYAELATALPQSGGEYNFLTRIYHPAVGFCTGLTSATVGFAAPIALNALLFGDFMVRAFPDLAGFYPGGIKTVLALVLVIFITAAHLRSLRFAGGFQETTTALTVVLILVFIVGGFFFTASQPITFLPRSHDIDLLSNPKFQQAFGVSLIYVMYSYSGWNAASYIVGEVKDPARTLPRALIFGTLGVMLLYVLVNAVFLYTTPLATLAGKAEVAHVAGVQIFGETGARLVSFLMSVGLIANISAMIWVGSRVSQAIGTNYNVLNFLSISSVSRVPHVALLVQLGIVLIFFFFDPQTIITYVESVLFFWCLLTVVGVIVLRFREPDLLRPYRAWGYPVTPLIFAAVAIFSLGYTAMTSKIKLEAGLVTILIGIPIYFLARNKNN